MDSPAPVIDLHCHPTLKIYLCNQKIYEPHLPSIPGTHLGMDVDLPGMKAGNVRVAFCSHYIPEAGFTRLPKSEDFFRFLRWTLNLRIARRFEEWEHSTDAWTKMLFSMKKLNEQIAEASNMGLNVTVAKNLAEFEEAYAGGKTVIVHVAEGSHQLGRGFDAGKYLQQLEWLKKEQGLALLTLGHFFTNDICDTGGGVPPKIANLIGYTVPKPEWNGLSPTGTEVVNWCQDNGVIVDLVHASDKARWDVYKLLDARREEGKLVRPVVFSHSGVREIAEGKMPNDHDKLCLPNLEELKQIRCCNGVLGLVLFEYWIAGEELRLNEDEKMMTATQVEKLELERINYYIKTIGFIKDNLGDVDNVAIGTDMDGFTRVPDEITHIRFIGRLRNAIAKNFGDEAAAKICYGNALRVIRAGWS